ncbi:flagellar hook capping FlgD N-terminal domain-containing protein [Erythrobacter donghaensis]|jgi:flagellar basal-body rod modification protein FlgD|uniref:flagellar hook capping FlgD N-terminal domain-containing protein n=1 Tax=Erythrobacter donghaensis TaxID=267135 RepID=UPI0009C0058C|nr:flagellar hook capping FlgD N-terminal domain-containing protein [Erythrobacter donghaensis]
MNTTNTTNSLPPAAQATLDRLNTPSTLRGGGLGSLDGGDFIRLLTTQLTFQDPLEPTDNQDMLAQMAQFSALAATTESGATLEDIAAKLDRLIEAQEATARAAAAANPAP